MKQKTITTWQPTPGYLEFIEIVARCRAALERFRGVLAALPEPGVRP